MEVCLNNEYAQYLKNDLCIKLGFCSLGEKIDKILSGQPVEISILIDQIFKAEGLNSEFADKSLLKQVREHIVSIQEDFESKYSV